MRAISKDALLNLLAYLLWLVSTAACAFAFMQLSSAITVLWAAFNANRYAVRLAGQVSLLVGGLLAFAYAIFLHGYYLESVKRKVAGAASGAAATQASAPRRSGISRWLAGVGPAVLLRRFAVTIAIPLGVIALSLALIEAAIRAIR